jgi:hypothetical protein
MCINRPPSDKGESLEHLNTSLYKVCNKYKPPTDKGESLEHLNTPLYRVCNKHRQPSDKGESLEHLEVFRCSSDSPLSEGGLCFVYAL